MSHPLPTCSALHGVPQVVPRPASSARRVSSRRGPRPFLRLTSPWVSGDLPWWSWSHVGPSQGPGQAAPSPATRINGPTRHGGSVSVVTVPLSNGPEGAGLSG